MAKKFELTPLDKNGWLSAKVNGKWRGLVEKTGRSTHILHLGKNDVTNFKTKKSLEEWLIEKWA